MTPQPTGKELSDKMSAYIPPPGLPNRESAQDHELFMTKREEFLKENGYYLDPYYTMDLLYPESLKEINERFKNLQSQTSHL